MRNATLAAAIMSAVIAVTGCGGKTSSGTSAPASKAAAESTTAAEETMIPESTESDATKQKRAELTKEGFIQYFDYILDNVIEHKEAFFIEFNGTDYYYPEFGDLYDALRAAGGKAIVKPIGEDEEAIDFAEISYYLTLFEEMHAGDAKETGAETEADGTETEAAADHGEAAAGGS